MFVLSCSQVSPFLRLACAWPSSAHGASLQTLVQEAVRELGSSLSA